MGRILQSSPFLLVRRLTAMATKSCVGSTVTQIYSYSFGHCRVGSIFFRQGQERGEGLYAVSDSNWYLASPLE